MKTEAECRFRRCSSAALMFRFHVSSFFTFFPFSPCRRSDELWLALHLREFGTIELEHFDSYVAVFI